MLTSVVCLELTTNNLDLLHFIIERTITLFRSIFAHKELFLIQICKLVMQKERDSCFKAFACSLVSQFNSFGYEPVRFKILDNFILARVKNN